MPPPSEPNPGRVQTLWYQVFKRVAYRGIRNLQEAHLVQIPWVTFIPRDPPPLTKSTYTSSYHVCGKRNGSELETLTPAIVGTSVCG